MVMEKREFPRSRVIINVDVQILGGPTYKGSARDISLGGICLDIFGDEPPKTNAKAYLDFIIWTGKENINRRLKGVVVRAGSASLALRFDGDPQETETTVKEILHYQRFERRQSARNTD